MAKKYDQDGMRVTDCCGAHSTYDEHGQLYCKACFEAVGPGEGDGGEYKRADNFVVVEAASTEGPKG